MYQYPPGSYGRPQVPLPPGLPGAPPGFNFPPGAAGPPGVVNYPPGMPGAAPPGVNSPPGIPAPGTAQPNLTQRPGISGFVPPTNLPNINFNAPIIRLGTSTSASGSSTKPQPFSGGGGSGIGGGNSGTGGPSQRHHLSSGASATQSAPKDSSLGFHVPSAEEQLKTLFITSIPKDLDDEWMEKILKAAASLRKWVRATDEDHDLCSFGFAEFDDFLNLKIAKEVLGGLELPANDRRKEPRSLKAVVDDKAHEYLEQVEKAEAGGDEGGEGVYTARYESARTAVNAAVAEFANPERRTAVKLENGTAAVAPDSGQAGSQEDTEKSGQSRPEIVTISLSIEDELSDIPADMRDVVAKEIAAFRERSNRRDQERIKREEEIERQERDRSSLGRSNRYSSPPASAPTGPSAGSNAIPVGPSRMRGDAPVSAPTQPSRMGVAPMGPSSHQNGAKFVNESSSSFARLPQEEDDSDTSDLELEEKRKAKKTKELDTVYQDHERRWLSRERSRNSAVDRESARDRDEKRRQDDEKTAMTLRLAEWDDDVESERKIEDYYIDHSQWIRNRAQFRAREKEMDERDKVQESRQKEAERKAAADSAADNSLGRQAEEPEKVKQGQEDHAQSHAQAQPQAQAQAQPKIVLSLGASARKAHDSARPRRTVADVEGLLEDEEEDAARSKRVLIPIQYDESAVVSEEKRDELVKSLAQEIPSDKDGLWNWEVKWEFIDEAIIKDKLQPFIEKKIVEYLGVQEQELINFVLEHIRKRGTAETLVKELEMALDEDAEVLVKKIWRMLVFFSESERRGLGS